MPFEAPAGYFEKLPGKLLLAVKNANRGKTIALPGMQVIFSHIRLAAAAVLLLCIGLGAYTTFFNQAYRTHTALQKVPASVLQEYIENTGHGVEGADLSSLQFKDEDIVIYLNETGWE
jgi:hypothetical protein